MMNPAAKLKQLNREAILSASPAKLLTMLYDRLLLDLNRAHAAQEAEDWAVASENLVHAQAILAELAASLDDDAWKGAAGLRAIYNFATQQLVQANISREPALTAQVTDLMEPLRQTWHEAAAEPVQSTGTTGIQFG